MIVSALITDVPAACSGSTVMPHTGSRTPARFCSRIGNIGFTTRLPGSVPCRQLNMHPLQWMRLPLP